MLCILSPKGEGFADPLSGTLKSMTDIFFGETVCFCFTIRAAMFYKLAAFPASKAREHAQRGDLALFEMRRRANLKAPLRKP
jgi:hypothetical protein